MPCYNFSKCDDRGQVVGGHIGDKVAGGGEFLGVVPVMVQDGFKLRTVGTGGAEGVAEII